MARPSGMTNTVNRPSNMPFIVSINIISIIPDGRLLSIFCDVFLNICNHPAWNLENLKDFKWSNIPINADIFFEV